MAALGCAAAPSSAPADAIARGEQVQVRVRVRVREIWAGPGRLWEGNLWWMPIGVRFFPPIGKGREWEGKGMDDLSILRAGLGQDRGKLAYANRSTLTANPLLCFSPSTVQRGRIEGDFWSGVESAGSAPPPVASSAPEGGGFCVFGGRCIYPMLLEVVYVG
jgi:hypothetical protein